MSDGRAAAGARRVGRRGTWSIALGAVLVVGGLVFVIRRLAADWDEVEPLLADAAPGWLAIALVLAVLGMIGVGLRWLRCLHLLGADAGAGDGLRWFARGQLGKYVPGGIWHVVGQGELAVSAGIARSVSYASVLLATVGIYAAAAVTATALAIPAGGGGPGALAAVAAVAAAVIAFEPRVLRAVLARRAPTVRVPDRRRSVRYLLGGVWVWLVIGAATAAVAAAIDGDASLALVASAAVASWLLGFLALPAPGGLGVREASFVLLTEHELGSATAASIALAARVVFVLADLLLPVVVAVGSAAATRVGQRARGRAQAIVQGSGAAKSSTTKVVETKSRNPPLDQ